MLILYALALLLCLVAIVLMIVFFIIRIYDNFVTDAPFVPIPDERLDMIVDSFHLLPDSVFYDLGCGNGKILIKVSQKYPRIKVVGVELGLFPYLIAKIKTRKYKNIEIRRENILETDINNATHIFIYLFPAIFQKLFPKIEKECKPETKVFSCDFEYKNKKPEKVIDLGNNRLGKKLFIYTI